MTLNEVNIIKNSVLDATEAYVDARLSIADFAKTQIGVTEGTPQKANGKYYHTVRCNAISGVADSGVVYHNVLSVGNTEFPNGSVVFLIAPNAQFSNQFILGKLDNTPVHITGGSISIGGTETRPNFSVDTNGVVRIRKGEITLGGSESAPNFRVDNDGNVYIKKGEINIGERTISGNTRYDVNLNKNGINLGYLGTTDNVDQYNFSVTNRGVVTIRSGSINLTYNSTVQDYNFKVNSSGINLGVTGTNSSDKSYNFSVNSNGKVTIKSGSINLGLISGTHLTTKKYTFVADENGNLSVGAYEYQSSSTSPWSWQYHFKLTKDGDLTAGTNFKLDRNGNLFSGGTSTANAKFYVTNTGNLYVGGATSTAPFRVDNAGNVYIKQGEITIGTVTSGSKTFAAFNVSSTGSLTMRRGAIRMDYQTTTEGVGGGDRYNVNINSDGIHLGYLGDTGSGTASNPYKASYNFTVEESGTITIKKGSINLGLNTTDNKYNFSVTNAGKLFARSGEIAGFTINPNSLTTDGASTGDRNAKSELSSTTLRVSKWTGEKRVSTIIDVDDNNGRIAINGDDAAAPYMAVSSSQGWSDSGNFVNPLRSASNYVKITPTSISLHEAGESAYTVGAGCFKFLSQCQENGDIGNLKIMVSDNLIVFENTKSGNTADLFLR